MLEAVSGRTGLYPVGPLQFPDIANDGGNVIKADLGLLGHTTERPVMRPNAIARRQHKGLIDVMAGFVDLVN